MKILIVTNLYPPHHAGTYDQRCQTVVELLRLRGHELRVLTSNHGLLSEQRDEEIDRRLLLNGVYEHPAVSGFKELSALETANHAALREAVTAFRPDMVYIWSLHGLSKSLIFALRQLRLPFVFDVADHWLARELAHDPWLRFWNSDQLSFKDGLFRRSLELSGQRGRQDSAGVPTRCQPGVDRIPQIFGSTAGDLHPNSVGVFHLDRIYFCSQSLKREAELAGFRVSHAEVIHPGIPTQTFVGEVKPASVPLKKLLLVAPLRRECGAMTALEAIQHAKELGVQFTLDIYGRGESDYTAQLRSYAVAHELPVQFLNLSNHTKDLPGVMRQHDAYLYTSEWEEPFSTAPLEAMACGVPVFGAQIGGVAELLRHGENCLAYPAGDAASLAMCLRELHAEPAKRCELADNAQQEVLTRFNEAVVTDQIETYLNESLEQWRQ